MGINDINKGNLGVHGVLNVLLWYCQIKFLNPEFVGCLMIVCLGNIGVTQPLIYL